MARRDKHKRTASDEQVRRLRYDVYDTDGSRLASFRRRLDAIDFLGRSPSSLCVCRGGMLVAYRREDGQVTNVNDADFNPYVAKIVLTRTRL